MAEGKQSFEMKGGEVPAAVQFVVVIDQLGTWTVKLTSSEHEVELPFEVVLAG